MWTWVVALALAGPVAASHEGTLVGDTVTWDTRVRFDVPDDRVALAVPLPPGTRVDGAVPELGPDGSIERLRLTAPVVRIRTSDPVSDGLHPPIVAGDVLQRVVLRDAAFRPDPELGLVKRLRYAGPAGLDARARRAFDRHLGRTRTRDQAVFVTGDRVARAGGLRGEVADRRAGPGGVTAVAGALFAAALLAMWALYRGLGRRARAEASLAYIERELGRPG